MARTSVGDRERLPFAQLYALKDMALRTHLPRSTIQRWGNLGVLLSEEHTTHGGRGIHRRFRESELILAALLKPFAVIDVPSGQLLRFAGVLRTALGLAPGLARGIHYEGGAPEIRRALLRGVYGLGDAYLAVTFGEAAIGIEPIAGDGDAPAVWDLTAFWRSSGKRPEIVHVLDLAVLHGVLGEPTEEQLSGLADL